MNSDLIRIKKYYGEAMMHLCRSLFPSLLEQEGLLFGLLEKKFAYSKMLYDDICENSLIDGFKNYIYSLVDVERKEIKTVASPKDLLEQAGYTLYECKTEKDIQKFKKYYAHGEELCTFRGGRLNKCYVFFAVKKDVDDIKRENFTHPTRQDEYGTSVISIQFTRGTCNTLSIKNRYNHTVNNPDATFSNNLDNIIEGLTASFTKHYKFNINQNSNNFELPNYVRAIDGKFYKYNYEIYNIYYCPDNIIIDNFNVVKDYQEKEKYLLLDYFIIDLENKIIKLYDEHIMSLDSFASRFNNIKLIEIVKDKETRHKKIGIVLQNGDRVYIEADVNNRMIYYQDDNIQEIPHRYLKSNLYLQEVSLASVVKINSMFLLYNKVLRKFNAPCVQFIGSFFMDSNESLQSLNFPELIEVDSYFLELNETLCNFSAPNLEIAGNCFLRCNLDLVYLELLKLEYLGHTSLFWNEKLKKIDAPNLKDISNYTLTSNRKIQKKLLSQIENHVKIKK